MTTTTTMTAPVPAHLVAVVSDGYEYLAECSCGWASDWHPTPDAADAAGAEHTETAVGPPDAMDRIMSSLLDLQDDIATVVMWLAENWSAHLPVLGWSASGGDYNHDRPVMRVLGYCAPSELAGAAAALGTAPSDDPPNDRGHTRYRRVIRDFGRVRIDIYTSLTDALSAETVP
jgi:hypothetical protein